MLYLFFNIANKQTIISLSFTIIILFNKLKKKKLIDINVHVIYILKN